MNDKQVEQEVEAEQEAEELTLDPVVEELKAAKEQLLRLAADFDNFRKRSIKEREEAFLAAKATLLGAFLPVMDNLERAMPVSAEGDGSPQAFRKGVEMIFAQFCDIFACEGAACFGAPGEPFDPEWHNAVLHIENPALGENVIAEVFSKGWRVGEKLIREATVGVAN